ncbi:PilZ domain-containing protein [Desulfocurvibacter africanus]|uniref:PilZ domain-containing protein n=1 Tax=Desulfocurvibacter africanus TaxID=873 RepID=UPI0004073468|nr:PilZ domain-containing protein [Desulfocurvibacter africanus]
MLRVLLLAEYGERRNRYEQALAERGVDIACVAGLDEMCVSLARRPCSGLLLDVPTLMRASCESNMQVAEAMAIFPVLRLNWDHTQDVMRCLFYGPSGAGHSLDDFLRIHAAAFHPRLLRRDPRQTCILHVELVREAKQGYWPAERTAVLSLSKSGCFVFTTAAWLPGDIAWLTIPSLGIPALRAVCRRVVPWRGDALGPQPWPGQDRDSPMGKAGGLVPGIGLSFNDITPTQRAALDVLLSGAAASRHGQGA